MVDKMEDEKEVGCDFHVEKVLKYNKNGKRRKIWKTSVRALPTENGGTEKNNRTKRKE